ncbi:MAG: hypothetical protein JWM33_2866, partial [Caulobacteraceae bacterium]|nr:hypothetical protein [Caulobacteraceae bacterium]
AAAGAATGGVLGALKHAGHTDEEANVYAEGVRRGGVLVSVKPDNDAQAAQAERILAANAGVDAAVRGDVYRQSGWSGFDEAAAPYVLDEGRSFAGNEDLSVGLIDDEVRGDTVRPIDPSIRSY